MAIKSPLMAQSTMTHWSNLPSDSMMEYFERADKAIDPVALCWERLANMRTDEISNNTGARAKGEFLALRFLDKEVHCYISERCLRYADGKPINDMQTALVLLLYLQAKGPKPIPSQPEPTTQDPLLLSQLPHGEAFFQGPHIPPTGPLEDAYGKDAKLFLDVGIRLGGKTLMRADASFCLRVLPKVEMYFFLYEADDEFPAQVKIMVSQSINYYLALDAVWALCNVVVKRLLELKAQKLLQKPL